MAEEKHYMMSLSVSEMAVIRLIRDEHTFGEIKIVKANGEIRRVHTEQTYLIEDILKKYSQPEHTNGNGLANHNGISNTVE